jgi:flavin-dependent dehydrogenase
VFFTSKPPVENGILMAGDAAGVLDPFSGQGQSAALATGILAGDMIANGLSDGRTTDEIAAAYARAWKHSWDRRFQWSRILRLLMLHPALGSLAGRLAGERLIQFGIAATRKRNCEL